VAHALALRLGWPGERAVRLRDAAVLHDVGKIGVPDAILFKPGPLNPAEYEEVKEHAALGARIIEDVVDAEQVAWVRGHHERLDGAGYPDGLRGEAISDGARILAVADAFDSITASRPYKPPGSAGDALRRIAAAVDDQFDRVAVRALEDWVAAEAASPA
jgi:HD-GYP domain-containing protein (c-di-GMP phosphodiesterase class II)